MIQKKKAVLAYEEEPAFHPRPNDAGQDVLIRRPHKPVLQGLTDPTKMATITPHGELPVDTLNGVPFEPWEPPEGASGYAVTFPKGRVDPDEGLSYQANAITEAWEESGLKASIVAFLGDVDRSTTRTRCSLARRAGGTPTAMGWESQAVHLVPLKRAREVLDSADDHQVVAETIVQRLREADYDHFKNSVADEERHDAYARVWGVMYGLQPR